MEYSKKIVSVIIPVYRSRNYLACCVESILKQTYANMEIILVDDGSDDGSGALCDEYSHQYSNIFCIHQKNKGVSAARNIGIDNAKGEYILFVDSDDYIEADYLENAVYRLEHQHADMYLCGYQSVINGGKVKERMYYPAMNDAVLLRSELHHAVMKLFSSSTLHAIGTKVYRKDIIKKYGIRFHEKWKYYEDIYFCLNYLRHCNKICIHKKVMYYYQRDICDSLSKQSSHYQYASIYQTYALLYRLNENHWANSKDKDIFYKLYLEQIRLCLNGKIQTERWYTNNVHKLYKRLAGDRFYKDTLTYMTENGERTEYFYIRKSLFLLAWLLRKYRL